MKNNKYGMHPLNSNAVRLDSLTQDIKEGNLRTSIQWADACRHLLYPYNKVEYPIAIILDPDGWKRSDLDNSVRELIDYNEYQERVCSSTIQSFVPILKLFPETVV